MFLAWPAAARPATPPPMMSTLAGGTLPAAVIWPAKKRGKTLAASITALHAAAVRLAALFGARRHEREGMKTCSLQCWPCC